MSSATTREPVPPDDRRVSGRIVISDFRPVICCAERITSAVIARVSDLPGDFFVQPARETTMMTPTKASQKA